MAGYPNRALEARVRGLLRYKRWREASDRAVAEKAGVSRCVVRRVRAALVEAGLIPRPEPVRHQAPGTGVGSPVKIRGGYLLLPDGTTVREADRLRAELERLKRTRG